MNHLQNSYLSQLSPGEKARLLLFPSFQSATVSIVQLSGPLDCFIYKINNLKLLYHIWN